MARHTTTHLACLTGLVLVVLASLATAAPGGEGTGMTFGTGSGGIQPLPEKGQVPSIFDPNRAMSEEELAQRAATRDYARQIKTIRHDHFGKIKAPRIREAGIALLKEFTDPAAFAPMLKELRFEQDDVRLAVLDHLAAQGDEGQAALSWVAIFDDRSDIRNEAKLRLKAPASPAVLRVLNSALRSRNDSVANLAAGVANTLHATQTIPLLIFAQGRSDGPAPGEGQGDLAWIAIETQRAYVVALNPVVGDASGGFAPVIGTVSEGTVLRVVDAVAIVYRTEVHNALVAMTTHDWGQSTAGLDYDVDAWWSWYNNEYVPFKKQQAAEQAAAAKDAASENAPPVNPG